MEAKARTRRRLSAQAWSEVFRRFDGSGESVTGFCKREGLHTSSFRRWHRRLAAPATPITPQAREPREAKRQASAASFIEMGAMGAASQPAGRLEVRLELGGGLVLQLVRG
jgi:putative transposase